MVSFKVQFDLHGGCFTIPRWPCNIIKNSQTHVLFLTCFRVLVFPVLNLIYLAISSFLPYIFPSSDKIIFLLPQGGYIARASWKLCSISGAQTPSASCPPASLSSSNSLESNFAICELIASETPVSRTASFP